METLPDYLSNEIKPIFLHFFVQQLQHIQHKERNKKYNYTKRKNIFVAST